MDVKKLLLAPHNDDESLFAAFSCLAFKPHVVVCLRSHVQERDGVGYREREKETDRAMRVLGCTWEQWSFGDIDPDWDGVEVALRRLRARGVGGVFAPLVEAEGHAHHNEVGALADHVFGEDSVVHYATYTRHGKTETGTLAPVEPWMVALKLQALACYESQHRNPNMLPHFLRDLSEYYG